MRLTELIEWVREKIADPNKLYKSDVQIARELNAWERSLFRRKALAHPSYGAAILDISATDNATQIHQLESDEWVYYLPSWVMRVQKVWQRDGLDAVSELPFTTGNDATGWQFHSNRSIVVKGSDVALNLRLRVTRLPARMFRGVCTVQGPDLASIVIPTVLPVEVGATEAFPLDMEDGALLGAVLEVTSSDSAHDPRGVLAVVTDQVREWDTGLLVYKTVLTVRPAYADFVKVGDTFESHSQIEDAHTQLLILRTAESLFHASNNVAGVQVLQTQLAKEERDFTDSLVPRESGVFNIMQTEELVGQRRDDERDPGFTAW